MSAGARSAPERAPELLELDASVAPAAFHGDLDKLASLLDGGADPSAERSGSSGLGMAAAGGKQACLALLLAAGADIEAVDRQGQTPLAAAARWGRSGCLAALLAAGADKEARDRERFTPLMLACEQGQAECAALLLAAGADVHARDAGPGAQGGTALMAAAWRGQGEAVRLLLQWGAAPEARAGSGDGAADLARRNGHEALGREIDAWALALQERQGLGEAAREPELAAPRKRI